MGQTRPEFDVPIVPVLRIVRRSRWGPNRSRLASDEPKRQPIEDELPIRVNTLYVSRWVGMWPPLVNWYFAFSAESSSNPVVDLP